MDFISSNKKKVIDDNLFFPDSFSYLKILNKNISSYQKIIPKNKISYVSLPKYKNINSTKQDNEYYVHRYPALDL